MPLYGAGAQNISGALTGAELVDVDNGGSVKARATTQQIANLAGAGVQTANTSITTAGNGTLTAAGIVGRLITRSGPTGAYTDTTATAAAIVAADANAFIGQSFILRIKNTVGFPQTISAGTGVTLSGITVVAPNSVGDFLVTLTSLTAVAINGIAQYPISIPALNAITGLSTVGAGTITAAGIAGGVTSRTGSQSNTAFTDTTDTAANIIAAQPDAQIGQSWYYSYQNSTNATATLAGGSGVTVSGITAVPGGCTATYIVTYTAAATVTMVGFETTAAPSTVSGTFVANGASAVTVNDTRVTANSSIVVTLKTVGGTVGAIPAIKTITPGTGFTIAGTASDTSTYNYLIIN